jgi:UDP-glucose 4-epimerase
MKILVTGGAGFIASHVADLFIAQGHQVAILDNFSTGKRQNIPANAQFFEADITNRESVAKVISEFKPEVINHHAAHIQVGYSVLNPQFDATSNILGLLNIMEEARLNGVKKVMMASTGGAMYGDQPTPFNESMKEQPLSPYGVSKRAGELYLHYYYSQYQIPYVVLRYSNVYGPRQNPHGESGIVSIFAEKMLAGQQPIIYGAGTNTRDYVHVHDVAQANLLALNYGSTGIFNIGTTTEITANEIFHVLNNALGTNFEEIHGPARPGEQTTSSLDYSLATRTLGWKPTISFQEGIQDLVKSLK